MFSRSNIANEVCTCHSSGRSPNSSCDMVMTWGNVCDQIAKYIVRNVMTKLLLKLDRCWDLVQWHVTRALYHDLHPCFQGSLNQFSGHNQALDLGAVQRIFDTTRPNCVSNAKRHIVFFANIEYTIKLSIKRVVLLVVEHPTCYKSPSTTYNICNSCLLYTSD